MESAARRCAVAAARCGSLRMKHDPVRLTLIDTLSRQGAIEMIVGALRSMYRLCDAHKFGGSSPDVLWRLVNGIAPGRRRA